MKVRNGWMVSAASVVAVAATLLLVPLASADATAASANNNPKYLQVYNNNIENLPTANQPKCPGDWKDLFYYMRLQGKKPDIYTIQQVSNQKQLTKIVKYMEKSFGEGYSGVIADKSPKKMNSPCGDAKKFQTNAIVFRTKRLELQKTGTWQSQAVNSKGKCVNNNQARTVAVKAKLHDKVADKAVTAASVHWATGKSGGPPCAKQNATELAKEMTDGTYGGALSVVGGDFNTNELKSGGGYAGWYEKLNGDRGGKYGYRDAIYSKCATASGGTKACLKKNFTIGGDKRIDFVFAKTASGPAKVTAAHTITFDEGDRADDKITGGDRTDRSYSQHRAIKAHLYY